MPAILVDGLIKKYGDNVAVNGISFEVQKGEIFGMLGPNGAGKTTTCEILEGLRDRDSGRCELLGQEISVINTDIKQKIGVALQTTDLMPMLTCYELLELFGTFYEVRQSPESLLEKLGLGEKRNARSKTLSGGQKQRLSVALALVNNPELVFLDEPTTGLDPQARRSLWEVVQTMKNDGKTVFLTTHYMDEAEQLCDRVAIMDHGKIMAIDSPQALIANQFSERAITVQKSAAYSAEQFENLPNVARVVSEENDILIYSTAVQKTLGALIEFAEQSGFELGDINIRKASLEDVFLKLTGRRIRE